MHTQFLRIKRLQGKDIIRKAAKHNHREIQAEYGAEKDGHIDQSRIKHNKVLRGASSAQGVADEAQLLMGAANLRPLRKDAVRALEVIVSLPPDSKIDNEVFFNDSIQWIEGYFKAPIISAIIHNDESTPHCHVLILPLINSRMVGSDLHGGKNKLLAMQADFYGQVGQRNGLTRQAPQKRYSATVRREAIELAFNKLKDNSGLLDAVLRVLVDAHLANPEPLMVALGLSMSEPKSKKTFVKIMTKPCKPEKPIGFEYKKPIGFDAPKEPEKEQTLSCVGFQISQPVFLALNDEPIDDYVRENDDANLATNWDCETGEYFKPEIRASTKAKITMDVGDALKKYAKRTIRY